MEIEKRREEEKEGKEKGRKSGTRAASNLVIRAPIAVPPRKGSWLRKGTQCRAAPLVEKFTSVGVSRL